MLQEFESGREILVDVDPAYQILAARAQHDGFWAAISTEGDQLWLVGFDGTTSVVGAYPSSVFEGYPQAVIDGAGNLWEFDRGGPVVRRVLNGETEIVDDGTDTSWFVMDRLVTGP